MPEKGGKLLAFAAGTALTLSVWTYGRRWIIYSRINKKIKQKREKCLKAQTLVEQNLKQANISEDTIKRIVQLSFLELQAQLQDGSLQALDVLHAYQTMDIANALDSSTDKKAPLHGVPVSLKESFHLRGNDSTAGLGQFIGQLKAEDAVLVQVLKNLGAVPFVRTNIPQTMMMYECCNPIFGTTCNPVDPSRSPGGSTGGEAALIASNGSILGFGSDIGGSIRVPSHFCGIYGLKCTLERMSRKGHMSLSKGQTLVSGTVGPMARDLQGLITATKVLLNDLHFDLDPAVAPLKFRSEILESKRPLKIGFYTDDRNVPSVPACARAVLLAKQALETMGHSVVEFVPLRMKYVLSKLYYRSVLGDKGWQFVSKIQNDIVDPLVYKLTLPSRFPDWLIWILSWVIQKARKDPQIGDALRARIELKSVADWFQHAISLQNYKDEFLRAWRTQNLDAVICPVFATVAPPNQTSVEFISAGSYCMLYNVLNYPGGAVPVTKVTRDDVSNMADYPNTSFVHKRIQEANRGSEGLPVSVQCVALPYQEELVLRVMSDIEAGLKTLHS
ncbi:fatty-acid amide hydrolase 1-like isoform X2 [Mya arenaria]|uniref:fatty-acid amide hydrolase 1-like isoform X2 n=1 Tax=Mya arenaria TaxID=6604 RepID=UPI0022E8E728|nr:fatty-acid amide hydrolase 1-like isoform X2 [Mya arenaria]